MISNFDKHIQIWAWEDAPPILKKLSDNGGDEDWLAIVPPHLAEQCIQWLEVPSFGCCCVDEYEHPWLDGYVVRVGCHA